MFHDHNIGLIKNQQSPHAVYFWLPFHPTNPVVTIWLPFHPVNPFHPVIFERFYEDSIMKDIIEATCKYTGQSAKLRNM